MVLTKRTSNLPLICQICGDNARGINFDVMTCMSCKAFFRRHALQSKNFQCQLSDDCKITRITRSGCTACRLKKCFSLGMNSELIRNKRQKSYRNSQKKLCLLPKLTPLNLLENDNSKLSASEWNLLSNIIHVYDESNSTKYVKSLFEQQLALPPKLRSKSSTILDIVGSFYSTVQSFMKRVPFFDDLSIDARRTMIQHNSNTLGTFNSLFLIRETGAMNNSAYVHGCCNIYGQENYYKTQKFVSNLEQNGTLLKLMILILAYTPNCSMVVPDYSENLITISSTISFLNIQNNFITMFWKYLIYQYGFLGAIKCLNSLIKFILNIIRWADDRPNPQHSDMVDTLIENTTQSLIIK